MCDQEEEDIQHLLIGCVVARQVWFSLFHQIGFSQLAPTPTEASFDIWWENVEVAATGDMRKGLNSLVIFGAWCIWKHRNDYVFNGSAPSVAAVLTMAREEDRLWSLAGDKGLTSLYVGDG
jgi:hypothetical protein